MSKLLYFLKRNRTTLGKTESARGKVTLEWWQGAPNAGDAAAPYVYRYMLQSHGLDPDSPAAENRRVHLMTIGSIIGMGNFDAVIWGSGIHTAETAENVMRQRRYVRYDIRAVRGPVTAEILRAAGYDCPDVYGEPAVLLPEIYQPAGKEKKYACSLIRHYTDTDPAPAGIHKIDIKTDNIEAVIDEIAASGQVISSSLHGIIIAEAYGIPAVFLGKGREHEIRKFHDWYSATGRPAFRGADSIAEALRMEPETLPDLTEMQKNLKGAFPADLWKRRL